MYALFNLSLSLNICQRFNLIKLKLIRAHTAPLFKELKILPLDDLITYSRIKFMHSFHFKKLLLSFAEMWQTNFERNPERALRNANEYYIPPHRAEIVKRMPIINYLVPNSLEFCPRG